MRPIESGSPFPVNLSLSVDEQLGLSSLVFLCRIPHQTCSLMKRLLLFFILSAVFAHGHSASDALPFPVSVGGQAAKDDTPFATIENPVAVDAELSVGSKDGMIIVNVHAVNAKNEPVPGSTPAVILFQGKPKQI